MSVTRFSHAARFALVSALVLAACDTDRTTSFTPVGPPSFDFGVGPAAARLPSGTATVGATSVTVSVSNLKALASGQYQFWVMGRDAQNLDVPTRAFGLMQQFFTRADTLANGDTNRDPVSGDPIFVTDSLVVSATRADAFTGFDDPAVLSVRAIIDSTADGSNPATNHAVFVTIESGAATTPSDARFLFRRIGVGGSGALSFGNFGGSDVISTVSPNDYVYGVVGAGQGGVRGDEISIDFAELSRPPVGFFYRGWLVDADGNTLMVDTLRSAWSADSTVSRLNMVDADVNDLLPNIALRDIRAAQIRNCRSGAGVVNCQSTLTLAEMNPFKPYLSFQLVMEPKGGSANKSLSITHAGDLPDEVTK